MPREAWRDHPEYLALWRAARQQPDGGATRLVLADWLEEHGQGGEAWCERLHGLTGSAPARDPATGVVRAGMVPMGEGAWRRLLAAPPDDSLLCVFDRDPQAYRYLREYRGCCGWDLGQSDWSSRTEHSHLLAVPRLKMLACALAGLADWDWIMGHLSGLTHFEADGPMIDPAQLAGLTRLPRLRCLAVRGSAAYNTTAVRSLPGLRHLSLAPFSYEASRLAELAPEAESLHADPENLGEEVHWPRLRSLQMLSSPHPPFLGSGEVKALSRLPLLERLDIRCGRVTAAAVQALAGLPLLRELTLRFEDHSPPSLKGLARAPALESLTVEGPLDAARIAEIVKLTGLRVLSLSGVEEGGRGLDALSGLTRLEQLSLSGEGAHAAGLQALVRLPLLERLDVQNLTMPARVSRAVKEAFPPWVECLVPDAE